MERKKFKLPEGWKWVKLGEVIEKSKERNTKNLDIVFTVSNKFGLVIQEEYFNRKLSSEDTTKYKVVRPYYFAYNPARINVGSIAINNTGLTGIISPMYVVFKTRDNLLPEYFKYHIQRKIFNNQVHIYTAGSVRESLNYSDLENFDFLLSPLPEQKKIAEILETVDNAIEKTEKIIEKYKRIKQGLMQELLTKGIDENGNIRTEKTHRFKDSPLGRIPEEWEVVRLGDVVKHFQYGLSNPMLKQGKYRIIKMDDVDGWYVRIKSELFVNIKKIIFKKYRLREGDILINRTNSLRFVGRVSLFNLNEECVFASYLIRLKIDTTRVDNTYLVICLSFLHRKLKNLATPAVQQANLNVDSLKGFKIPLPPLPEQHRIVQILSQLDKVIEKEENYKKKLESLKRGLIEDLLTGKVRVNKLLKKEEIEYG